MSEEHLWDLFICSSHHLFLAEARADWAITWKRHPRAGEKLWHWEAPGECEATSWHCSWKLSWLRPWHFVPLADMGLDIHAMLNHHGPPAQLNTCRKMHVPAHPRHLTENCTWKDQKVLLWKSWLIQFVWYEITFLTPYQRKDLKWII